MDIENERVVMLATEKLLVVCDVQLNPDFIVSAQAAYRRI